LNSKKGNAVHAIVVLPAGLAGRIRDQRLRRWLSKGRTGFVAPEGEMLHAVAELIGQDARDDGLAALHFWGQTGERAGTWMAATDPVHLEARLDHLYLHDLRGEQMPRSDLQSILDFLQATFGSGGIAFARLGDQGYLRGEQEIATARVTARRVHGLRPDDFMPKPGEDRKAKDYHRLLSEVQMALHEHVANNIRIEAGLLAVNSLWIWGGGVAPEVSVQPIFPLFSNDPLFKGFWLSRSGVVEPWSDGFESCVALAQKGFVAIAPETAAGQAESPDRYLQALKGLLAARKINRLTLLFRDGLRVDIGPRDVFRFWRGESPLLKPQ
jgi:hypothetical protein